jgi:hypothetical protein
MQLTLPATLMLGALIFSATPIMSADLLHLQSGAAQTALLELYTSEGCSSCPAAEVWLTRLKDSPRLWKDFVPVAFHVDYWDYLGWKDPFAAKAYAQRQRAYASHWRSRAVYTPGFVLDGKEWRGWSGRDELPRGSDKPAGKLTARSEDGRRWRLRYEPATSSPSSAFELHAALLGFDLISDIKAGENRGRKLQHDFAVLALVAEGSAFEGVVTLKSALTVSPGRLALAAWVTQRQSLAPLQSLGGWISTPGR